MQPVVPQQLTLKDEQGGRSGRFCIVSTDLGKMEAESEDDNNMDHTDTEKKLLVNESNQMRAIFPEEVWIKLIDQLTDSTRDLQQLSNASLYFRKLLLHKMTLFQFSQILKLAVPRFVEMDHKTALSTVLRCRPVCKSWNKAVDSFLQEEHPKWKQANEFRNFKAGRLNLYRITPEFYSLESVRSFLQHFHGTHPGGNGERCPFIVRDVNIICMLESHDRDRPHFINLMTYLLQQYGHHIRHLHLRMNEDFSYSNLIDWLLPLVNLKSLDIGYRFQCPGARAIHELAIEIWKYPLPNMTTLETLETCELPAPLFNEIIRKCNQISTLNLEFMQEVYYSGDPNLKDYAVGLLPNLTHLKVHFRSWESLMNLGWVQGKIKRPLSITLSPYSNKFVKWSEICRSIQEKWGSEPVDHLSLELPEAPGHNSDILTDSTQFRLKIFQLRHLELRMGDMAHLDFLLGSMASLETLKIVMTISENYSEAAALNVIHDEGSMSFCPMVQFLDFERRMLESNIWKMFPKLKYLIVEDFRRSEIFEYTRAQWINRQQHQQ